MLLSRSCQYGIQAVLYISKNSGDSYISIKKIADANNISFHFLGKILQKLTQKGILTSFKGPNGGVCLSRPADSINLLEVIEAIDGLEKFENCVIGLPACNGKDPCVLHRQWRENSKRLIRMFEEMTIKDLINSRSE